MGNPDLGQIAQQGYDRFFVNNGSGNNFQANFGGPDAVKANAYAHWFYDLVQNLEPWTLDYTPYGSSTPLKLYARYLAQPDNYSHKTVIVAHGLWSNSINVGPWARVFFELGFNVLAPDARGYGLSKDPCRNLGILDSNDILSWAGEVIKKDPQAEIVLFGYSMGAANVLESSYKNKYGNVIAVIEDCGYSQLDNFTMRNLQQQLGSLTHDQDLEVLQLVDEILYKKQNIHIRDGLTETGLSTTTLPIMTIHGTADSGIPPQDASRISSMVSSSIKYEHRYFVQGAPHYQSISYGGGFEAYKAEVARFLEHVANPDNLEGFISYGIDIANVANKGNYVEFTANVVKQRLFNDEESGGGQSTNNGGGPGGMGVTAAGNFDIVVAATATVEQPTMYYETDSQGNCAIHLTFDSAAQKPYNIKIRRIYGQKTYERTLSIP